MNEILRFLVALSLCFSAQALEPVRGYRVIHASPEEFTSALFMPFNRRNSSLEKKEMSSRLERYFRIKGKSVSNDSATLEIIPNVPLLGSLFEGKDAITVSVNLLDQKRGTYVYALNFKSSIEISSEMKVEPHPSGSLVTITVVNNSMNSTVSKMFYKTIFALGFLAEKPAEAK
jgi:hypothetical protein